MAAHDPVNRIQTNSRAFAYALRSEERLEEGRLHRIGNTWPIVDDLDENEIKFSRSSNYQPAFTAHGVDGIINKIGPNLVQLASTRKHAGKVGVELASHFHAAFEPEFQHGQRTFNAA